jgi:acylphosphatase
MMQNDQQRVRASVSGMVQGVGFRWFVVGEAERLGLRGWVRNTADGSVEVEMAGTPEQIEAMMSRLAKGPPAARVSAVHRLTPGLDALPERFEIVR